MRNTERERGREREPKGREGVSRVIVERLTTPHDLIVMLKTVGEAGGRGGEGVTTTDHCAVLCCVRVGGKEGRDTDRLTHS